MNINYYEHLAFDDVLIKPRMCAVNTRSEINVASILCSDIALDSPIISANMISITEHKMCLAMNESGGLGALHRFMDEEKFAFEVTQLLNNKINPIAFSVGIRDRERSIATIELANELRRVSSKPSTKFVVFIDVAHGHTPKVIELATIIKKHYSNIKVVAGNICTSEGAKFYEREGVIDAIKIGIGPGSVCKTREVTGAGVPQLSAIIEVASVANTPIIADGGIRNSGDIVKCLAAGADTVMIGRLFAGCEEAADRSSYMGNYSESVIENLSEYSNVSYKPTAEGISVLVEKNGSAKKVVSDLVKGIRSGISYAGCRDIRSLRKEAVFIRQSRAASIEGMTR